MGVSKESHSTQLLSNNTYILEKPINFANALNSQNIDLLTRWNDLIFDLLTRWNDLVFDGLVDVE